MIASMRILLPALIGLAVVLSASGETSIDPNGRYCDLSMDVRLNGRSIASNDAIVEFGKEAEFTIRDANHPHGWQVRFVVDEPTTIRRAFAMPTSVQLYEIADERSFLRAEPHLNVVPGQPAELEMALEDGRRIGLTVTAAILTGAEVQAHLDASNAASE